MNICIESHLLNHPRRSGVMTYTEGLVNGMSRVDPDNHYDLVYYSLRQKADEMPGPQNGNMRKTVLRVPDRAFWGREQLVDGVFLPAYFRKNKVDVFHRTAGYRMPKSKGVYKILTVHDLRTLTISDQIWEQNIDQYKQVFSAIDLCVVVSECTKMDLIKHFNVDEKKIKVTYLGADARYKRSGQTTIDAVRKKFGLNEPFFLSVGSYPRKNIEGIIRGFAKCKYSRGYLLALNCKFDIEDYSQLAFRLGLEGRVIFVKNVSDEDLVGLYSACHCFAFPSLYEGFGLPILEAMHCGTPVITSNISACPEVAGDAAILVDPYNVDEIGEAMDTMCRDTAQREAYIQKAYERVKLFSWDKFAGQMKEIYSGV